MTASLASDAGKHMFADTAPDRAATAGFTINGGFPSASRQAVLTLSAYATEMDRSVLRAEMPDIVAIILRGLGMFEDRGTDKSR